MKWTWTRLSVEPSAAWQLDRSSTPYTSFSVKYKQLGSFNALHLKSSDGKETTLPFSLSSIVVLDASINRLCNVRGIDAFPNVRELHLTHNQIQTLEGLEVLEHLCHLHAGNNFIESLSWLWPSNCLVHLDISNNQLKTLEGIRACHRLEDLNLNANQLTSFQGIEHLTELKVLLAQSNRFGVNPAVDSGLTWLLPLGKMRLLSLNFNQLSDLDTLAKVVFALTELEEVNCVDNPVTKLPAYRFRMCQNRSLKTLDHKKIGSSMRRSLELMNNHDQVDALVEKTTAFYLKHVEAQQRVLSEGVEFFRGRENTISQVFVEFKHSMEAEMDECLHFAHAVKNKPSSFVSSYLLSNAGIEEWKKQLKAAQDAQLPRIPAEQLHRHSSQQLLDNAPHVWRNVNMHENAQRQQMDLETPRGKDHSTGSSLARELRVEAVLDLAKDMENIPEISSKMKRLRDKYHTFDQKQKAATVIQRAYRKKKAKGLSKKELRTNVASVVVKASSKNKGFAFWNKWR
ncbi:hypothetical protein Ae201684P_013095 [Aphanomyces euteiches]|nr:hypothetical protein Ae201684P_013095 [Aphanomyces euteiches]KAH9158156.1 hypothetical protein AeRB84_000097 [Aphanomyces euteiches]